MQKYFYQLAALLFAALSFTACTAEEDPTESDTLEVNVSKLEAPEKVTAGVPVKLSVKMTSTLEKIDKIIIYKNDQIFFDYDGESPRDLVNTPGKLRSGDAIKEVVKNKQYEYTFNDMLTLADVQNGVPMTYRFEIVAGGLKNPSLGSVFTINKADAPAPPAASDTLIYVMNTPKTPVVQLKNKDANAVLGLRYTQNTTSSTSGFLSNIEINVTGSKGVVVLTTDLKIDLTTDAKAMESFNAVKKAYEGGTPEKKVLLSKADGGKKWIVNKLAPNNYVYMLVKTVDPERKPTGVEDAKYNGYIDFDYKDTGMKTITKPKM